MYTCAIIIMEIYTIIPSLSRRGYCEVFALFNTMHVFTGQEIPWLLIVSRKAYCSFFLFTHTHTQCTYGCIQNVQCMCTVVHCKCTFRCTCTCMYNVDKHISVELYVHHVHVNIWSWSVTLVKLVSLNNVV